MMYSRPRPHSVYCQTQVETWALDRSTYARLMHGTFIRKRELYSEFLSKISFLKGLEHSELIQLADALEPCKFKKGENLISYGEEGEWFYIIVEGVVQVYGRDDNNAVIPVCTFTRGECVGELEFLHNHKTVADVQAKTDEVRAAKLNRHHFEMCMGPVLELLKRSRENDPVFSYYRERQMQQQNAVPVIKLPEPHQHQATPQPNPEQQSAPRSAGASTPTSTLKPLTPSDLTLGYVELEVHGSPRPYLYSGETKSLFQNGSAAPIRSPRVLPTVDRRRVPTPVNILELEHTWRQQSFGPCMRFSDLPGRSWNTTAPWAMMLTLLTGQVKATVLGQEYVLEPGDLLQLPPNIQCVVRMNGQQETKWFYAYQYPFNNLRRLTTRPES
eukprot:NODE_1582_length_1451_cov_43.632175_g1501_i0.p1 GENE.NODE_1582_length_1451_cov_43.632175_g1501_i0~~NODE_1582_length_1451_cov_43.632175_g1501_i0.p1  ORF type:complete len:449 (-),score=78.65 NODE_1582_length_1451_cov_43.632175_g1501_i0:104-1261(-)